MERKVLVAKIVHSYDIHKLPLDICGAEKIYVVCFLVCPRLHFDPQSVYLRL